MNESTRRALRELSRRFYRRRAQDFSASRLYPWKGWERVLRKLSDTEPLRVLDLGCGNARFASHLGQGPVRHIEYLGLDSCAELLDEARQRWSRQEPRDALEVDLANADIMGSDWPAWLEGRRFDLIVLFGVLHHVPSRESRRGILECGLAHLAHGGLLATSIWRFDRQKSFPRKILPWERYNREACLPIDTLELEPGDYLLTWAGDQETPRYCHLMEDDEINHLIRAFHCLDQYYDDGADGDHNLYLVFGRGLSSAET